MTEKAPIPKPGYKTTEFWISALTISGATLLTLSGVIPGNYGVIASAISAGLYAVSRGLAKIGTKGGP